METCNEDIINIIYDETKNKCRIVSSNYNFIKCIIQHFTAENGSAFFVSQHGYNISDEISVINALGYFDIGLFTQVFKAIKEYYPNEKINIINKNDIVNKIFPLLNIINLDNIKNISDNILMRPYQYEAVKAALKYGRGLIECPTGSGKSLIIGNIIHNLRLSRLHSLLSSIIIFVPTRQLVDQFYLDLIEYGFTNKDICKFTSNSGKKKDGTFEDNSCSTGFNQIIITNRDFAIRNKDKLPHRISMIICDEVHTLTPNSKTIEFIKNIDTDIKLGFTGTIPVDNYIKWNLIGTFGSILFTESVINLQEQEYLAQLKIISLDIFDSYVNGNTDLLFSLKTTRKFDKEDQSAMAIKFDEPYNDELKYINQNLYKLYEKPLEYICNSDCKNILILFDRTEFGQNIYKEAKDSLLNKNIYFIDGSIDMNIREKIRNDFEKQDGGVVFAQSKTFATGINIKNLDCIAFFFSGKGHTKIIQSIGRTLRLHKNKKYAKLYDISFNYKYSQKHKSERLEIYNQIYGKTAYDEVINMSI